MRSNTLLRMLAALILFLACCYFCDSLLLLASALLLTPKQAAEALAISPRKLWAMTASGEVPHVRLGRCKRYDIQDLKAAIERMKKGGQP